jgi:hypothetical protein
MMIDFHIRALDQQLSLLWHGFGLALALRRTLVMPQLQCHCVRNWFRTENCRLTGDYLSRLPFQCGIDQVRAGAGPRVFGRRRGAWVRGCN